MKKLLLLLLVALCSNSALHAASPLTPSKVRPLEIRKDALPTSIEADQLSVVVLMPVEGCSSASLQNRDIVTRWYCGAMASLALSPEIAAYQPTLLPDVLVSQLSPEVMEVIGDPSRRFVWLVDWAVDVKQYKSTSYFNINLATEELVYDRQTKQWLWHALRREDDLTKSEPDIPTLNKYVQRFFVKTMLPIVADRAKQWSLAGVALAWTATEDVLKTPAEGLSRLVFFNDYPRGSEIEFPSTFTLRKAPEEGQTASKGSEAVSFTLGYESYAALDVAPGKYVLGWATDQSQEVVTFVPGEVSYFRQTRRIFNKAGVSKMDKEEAASFLKKNFRSAVVPDTRPLAEGTSKFRFESVN
jgi:hypothetical protein